MYNTLRFPQANFTMVITVILSVKTGIQITCLNFYFIDKCLKGVGIQEYGSK